MSDERSSQRLIDLNFPQFATLFFTIITSGLGLLSGAYTILSQDLSGDSAIVLSGVSSVVVIATLATFYNRLTIERLKRKQS